ncbi:MULTISPECIES: hypothetical protein [Streptomyces]|uniref:hypothetical protein n=1 Tax=Streptomyces TaxID=1883 RepID=UPI0033B79356
MTAALRVVSELQKLNGADTLSDPTKTPVVRVKVETVDGRPAGEALLNPRAAEEIGDVAGVLAEYALAMPADYQAGRTVPAPAPELDPLLVADLEDMFAAIDPESYLADVFGGPDAEASLVAYEQMVTGEWDGQL